LISISKAAQLHPLDDHSSFSSLKGTPTYRRSPIGQSVVARYGLAVRFETVTTVDRACRRNVRRRIAARARYGTARRINPVGSAGLESLR